LGRDHTSDVFSVCGGTGTAAVDVGGDEMDFFAVFVGDSGAGSGAGVCSQNNAILWRIDKLRKNNKRYVRIRVIIGTPSCSLRGLNQKRNDERGG
jgi:hypothetical protein